MNARTREADLQDDVDRMKSEMAEDRYRIEELEALVDQWREKFDNLESQYEESRERWSHELERKSAETVDLMRALSEARSQNVQVTRMVMLDNEELETPAKRPKTPSQPYSLSRSPSLPSGVIPDISRVFSTATSPCLFKL